MIQKMLTIFFDGLPIGALHLKPIRVIYADDLDSPLDHLLLRLQQEKRSQKRLWQV
jgi:hypothetical protein